MFSHVYLVTNLPNVLPAIRAITFTTINASHLVHKVLTLTIQTFHVLIPIALWVHIQITGILLVLSVIVTLVINVHNQATSATVAIKTIIYKMGHAIIAMFLVTIASQALFVFNASLEIKMVTNVLHFVHPDPFRPTIVTNV